MKLRRIAYVLNIFPKLSETFIAGEMAELRRRGVAVRILSLLPSRDEPQHEFISRSGLDRIVEYDVARFPEVLEAFQPDLLHAHFAKDATEKAIELSTRCGVPFTFTAHGYDIHRKPPADFARRAAAARAVVTVSEANRDHIEHHFGVPRGRVHVIPCGVDTDQFSPPAPGTPADGEPPLLLCVARLVPVKHLGLLLETCALLRDRDVKFRCALVGDGPSRPELEARRAALGLEPWVELTGAAEQNEVRRWWQRAALGVLTSENEGMPVCLMEAAACGVPVVATAVGGIPELVEHGVTGLLAPPGDARALAAAIEMLLADRNYRRELGGAARQRAVQRYSVTRQVDSLLALWEKVLSEAPRPITQVAGDSAANVPRANGALRNIPCDDPFGAAADQELPTLAAALDTGIARHEFKRRLPRLSGNGRLRLKAIRVTRHKPGKRAVVEYDVEVDRPDRARETVTLIGKVRARRSGNEALRQLEAFWNAGFDDGSADGISVPEPIGVVSKFQMWLQRKVPGVTAGTLLAGPPGVALARRVADALHKVHRFGVPTDRQHSMADELRILRECFDKVAALKPQWSPRLARLLTACAKLGAKAVSPVTCGIHRDFYPAQVIVDGARLRLIDFDLYCQGDPGLDAGNFIGHVTEQALREHGDAAAFIEVERALEDRFVELTGEAVRPAVQGYATLTLARHIFLSTRFPERTHLTERLLELCEERLEVSSGHAGEERH